MIKNNDLQNKLRAEKGNAAEAFSVKVLRNMILGSIVIIGVLTGYYMLAGNFPSYFEPVNFSSYPPGKIPNWTTDITYYGFSADSLLPVLQREKTSGLSLITLHLNNGPKVYSGISLSWEERNVLPPGANIRVRWRGGKESFRVLVDLTVGGNDDSLGSPGTNYYVYLDSPHEQWMTTSIPLSQFKLNPVQRPGVKRIEPFDPAHISEISFTYFPGARGTIQIESVRFSWRSIRWTYILAMIFLLAFGMFLWKRTTERGTMSGRKIDLRSSSVLARIAYILFLSAFAAKIISAEYSELSTWSIIVYSLFFLSIVVDELFKDFLSNKILPTLKYAVILSVGFFFNFTFDPIQLTLLLAIAFAPIVLYRSRLLLAALPAFGLVVLLVHHLPVEIDTTLPGIMVVCGLAFLAVMTEKVLEYYELMQEANYASLLYAEVLESTTDGIFVTDREGKIERANGGFEFLTGYSTGEVTGRNISEFIRPDQVHRSIEIDSRNNSNESRSYDAEISTKCGQSRSALVREMTLTRNGKCVGYQAIATDITDRKRAEEELHQSNAFNEMLLRTLPFGISIVDDEGKILFMSEKLKETFGGDMVGQKCWQSYKGDGEQCEECSLLNGMEIGKSRTIEVKQGHGGKTFQVNHTGLVYEGKNAILEVFEDITERKELEDRIMQSQKMESLGTLASGIAHDFNNILGIVLGHSTLVQEKMASNPKISNSISAIVKAADRGASLVRQMLTFARKTDMELTSVSLNDSVEEIRKLFHETFPRTMVLFCDLPEDLPRIRGNTTQIH